MSEQPNPGGELVVCCKCGQRPTFTREALCGVCRGDEAVKKNKKQEEKR